jgi:3-hydroxyacyl-[acyl-carrier-protein] dehydratase
METLTENSKKIKTPSEAEILLAVVPQRYPFLMIDRILEHELNTRALCLKNITLGEEVFTGHFESNPIYPGVLMVEMGLQTTQVMLSDLDRIRQNYGLKKENSPPQGFLVMIEKFKYFAPVTPGDTLYIESRLDVLALGLAKCSITIFTGTDNNSQKVAEGKVSVTVKSEDKSELATV